MTEFVSFIRELNKNNHQVELYEKNLAKVYKQIMKNRKQNGNISDFFKFNMVLLTEIMDKMHIDQLPKGLPSGYQLVNFGGVPYVVLSGVYYKYKDQLSSMTFI